MKLQAVMAELAAKGSEPTKRLLRKHGATEPCFGVKVADLKVIQKQLKGEQALALELFATGNGDAQYLAGLIVNGARLTRAQVQAWAETAAWRMISATIVPWVAVEHPDGYALARAWIDSPEESLAIAGWNTLGAWVAVRPDDSLPLTELGALLDRVATTLANSPDRVRQAMNLFIIMCGTYSAPLGVRAIATARKVGRVEVDVGDTDCRIPDAESYILKSRRGAPVAPKRKTLRC